MDLPGVNTQDLQVEVLPLHGVLSIRGVRNVHDGTSVIKKHKFSRTFAMDTSTVQVDHVKANLNKGVLVVTAPKVRQSAPQCIRVQVTEQTEEEQAEEAEAADQQQPQIQEEAEQEQASSAAASAVSARPDEIGSSSSSRPPSEASSFSSASSSSSSSNSSGSNHHGGHNTRSRSRHHASTVALDNGAPAAKDDETGT